MGLYLIAHIKIKVDQRLKYKNKCYKLVGKIRGVKVYDLGFMAMLS